MFVRKKTIFAIVSFLIVLSIPLFGGRIIPIYDGVGFPDEPYRYVQPPATIKNNNPPTPQIEQTETLKDGSNNTDISLSSDETGPQILVDIRYGSLDVSTSATKVNILAKAQAPGLQPAIGRIVGNIYNLSAIADVDRVGFKQTPSNSKIQLRLPQAIIPTNSGQVIEFRGENNTWQKLNTSRVGQDIYLASVTGFGDYAIVNLQTQSVPVRNNNFRKIILPAVLLSIVIVILAAIIIAIRLVSRKRVD